MEARRLGIKCVDVKTGQGNWSLDVAATNGCPAGASGDGSERPLERGRLHGRAANWRLDGDETAGSQQALMLFIK